MTGLSKTSFEAQDIQGDGFNFRQGHDYYQAPVTINSFGQQPGRKRKPFSNVPFSRDPKFVGREGLLAQIDGKCSQHIKTQHVRMALVGQAGVGKSQIAIEYAYRHRIRNGSVWVFWVYASSPERFSQGYRQIADQVELPSRNDPSADILQLVYDWLCDEETEPWLLILDNADNTDTFFKDESVRGQRENPHIQAARYIPQCATGTVLMTSRFKGTADRLVDSQDNVLQVEPPGKDDCIEILKRHVTAPAPNVAGELVTELGHIPLAITQAASYIKSSYKGSPSRYLNLIQESESNREHLLGMDRGDLRRDSHAQNSVLKTWRTSFDQISDKYVSAAKVLRRMGVLDRAGIPACILEEGFNQLEFGEAITVLYNHSMVTEDNDGLFNLQRLVKPAILSWMNVKNELDVSRDEMMHIINKASPEDDEDSWSKHMTIIPHVQFFLKQKPGNVANLAPWASLNGKYANYLSSNGARRDAHSYFLAALEARKRALPVDHGAIIDSMSKVGRNCRKLMKFDEAMMYLKEASALSEKMFGETHRRTVRHKLNTTVCLIDQEDLIQAEKLLQELVNLQDQRVGSKWPYKAEVLRQYSNVLRLNGRLKDAYGFINEAELIAQRDYGKTDCETLFIQSRKLTIGQTLGLLSNTEHEHRKVLEVVRGQFGESSMRTTRIMYNLVETLEYNIETRAEAEELQNKVVALDHLLLGTDSPDTQRSYQKLAGIYIRQQRFDEAEVILHEAYAVMEQRYGPQGRDTLRCNSDLGHIYHQQGRIEEAEKLLKDTLQSERKILGWQHPNTMITMQYLGQVLATQPTRKAEGLHLMQEAVSVGMMVYYEESPELKLSWKLLKTHTYGNAGENR